MTQLFLLNYRQRNCVIYLCKTEVLCIFLEYKLIIILIRFQMCEEYLNDHQGIYTGCVKKDILNIHIKSEGINILFTNILLDRVYHICGQMSKVHIYSPIIYDTALFQT